MSGRHLRRSHRPDPRAIVVGLVVLLVGAVVGAIGVVVLDGDDDARTGVDAVEAPASTDPGAPGVAALAVEPGPIVLAFAGDVNAEGVLGDRLAADPDGFVGPFADVLRDADLAMVNVEAALTEGGRALAKPFTFRAPPGILAALRAGGVDVVSLANNHAIDFGPEGLADTLAARAGAVDPATGAAVVGIGADEDDAYAPLLREVGGHTVAVIAATQVLDPELIASWTAGPDQPGVASAKRIDRLVAEVADARAVADTVVVYLHWGVETEECPTTSQQDLARALVDAGADVVVGTEAHRVQGGGMLGDAFVGYGLGNFLFGTGSAASARTGVLLVEVDGRDVLGHRWVPGTIEGSVPRPLEGAEAEAEVAAWTAQRDCTGLTG